MYAERPSGIDGVVVWWRTPDDPGGLVLPDGCTDIIWLADRIVVAGPDTIAHPAGTVGPVTGVRFGPGIGPTVLGVPAAELRDQRTPLDAIWTSADVRRLADRLGAEPDGSANVLSDAVAERLRTSGPPPERDRAAAALLGAGHGVADVAERLGVTTRQLHRRSLTAFGYGPKVLARVLRFGRALAAARDGVALAEVAHRCGYADQSHLATEARALTGGPIGRLLGYDGSDSSGAKRSTPLPSGSRRQA